MPGREGYNRCFEAFESAATLLRVALRVSAQTGRTCRLSAAARPMRSTSWSSCAFRFWMSATRSPSPSTRALFRTSSSSGSTVSRLSVSPVPARALAPAVYVPPLLPLLLLLLPPPTESAPGEDTLPTAPATAEARAGTAEAEKSEEEEEEGERRRGVGNRANRRDSGDLAARMLAITSCRPLDLSSGTPLIAVRQSLTSTSAVDSKMPLLPSDPRGKALMKI